MSMMVSDLELRDEFALVTNSAVLSDVAMSLSPAKNKVVLVRAKKDKGIAGILKENKFLLACSKGLNPLKELARNHMSTDILRIREDTPFEIAINTIRERNPEGVLVLTKENKFLGYLSTADFREMGGEFPEPEKETPPPPGSVAEALELRDEFVLVPEKTNFVEIARKFTDHNTRVIMVRAKKDKGVAGIIPMQVFLQICAQGKDPRKEIARTHMLTNLMRIRDNTPINIALDAIEERNPDATLVLDVKNKFRGYLSPEDYRSLQQGRGEGAEQLPMQVVPLPAPSSIVEKIVIPPSEFTITNANSDELTIDVEIVTSHLQQSIGNGSDDPIIWSEDGSEVLVHVNTLTSTFEDGLATFSLDLECDQSGRETLEIGFYFGTNEEMRSPHDVTDERPKGHPIIVGRWGVPVQDVLWSSIIEFVENTARNIDGGGEANNRDGSENGTGKGNRGPETHILSLGAYEGQLWFTTDDQIPLEMNSHTANGNKMKLKKGVS
jgi:predicted transcriptional regulator